MTYKPEWPSEVTRPSQGHGLFQQLPSTWKEHRKPDQDALRQRVANLYAGKNRPTL